MDLSIVVPIYNEQDNIYELYHRIINTCKNIVDSYEIIFVDDGSSDNSISIIKSISLNDNMVKFISFSRNFGHQNAIYAGIINSSGKAIVSIDADLQDPPEIIKNLYQKFQEGYNIVYAKRIKRKGESFYKKITAKLFYRILKHITNIEMPVDVGDFRLIDVNIKKELQKMPENNKYIRGLVAWTGFKHAYVEYVREERKKGKTSFSTIKMIKFAWDGITSLSNYPLRFVTVMGGIVSICAFLIILYAIYSRFILKQYVSGWTSIIISSMFIGGIQLLSIGIIGEYIARINDNVRNRQQFIIKESNLINKNES